MIFDKEGNTTTVFQEDISLAGFLEKLHEVYPQVEKGHLILNLFSFGSLSEADILEFLNLSNTHRAKGKSFVLVSDAVSYEDVPDEINLVPSLQEARDLIEMEEIERDLDL